MTLRRFEDVSGLGEYLDSLDKTDCLFRGQTTHHTMESGEVSLSPSIARLGCTPALMRKWTHYALDALILTGVVSAANTAKFSQALLQHYGWRSFYLDLTSSYEVASWFAGNGFEQKPVLEIAEDCHGVPVTLCHKSARYVPVNARGHLYVLSKSAIRALGQDLFDATAVSRRVAERPHRQQAWLAGPLSFRYGPRTLPSECLVAHVTAPGEVFRQLSGTYSTVDLFPSTDEDPFLHHLFDLPWRRTDRSGKGDSQPPERGLFQRELGIPDYHFRGVGVYRPHTIFLESFWIADQRERLGSKQEKANDQLLNAVFYKTENAIFYNSYDPSDYHLPNLRKVLRRHPAIVVEIDDPVAYPTSLVYSMRQTESSVTKGIAVLPVEEGILEISEVVVEHPGTRIVGIGTAL